MPPHPPCPHENDTTGLQKVQSIPWVCVIWELTQSFMWQYLKKKKIQCGGGHAPRPPPPPSQAARKYRNSIHSVCIHVMQEWRMLFISSNLKYTLNFAIIRNVLYYEKNKHRCLCPEMKTAVYSCHFYEIKDVLYILAQWTPVFILKCKKSIKYVFHSELENGLIDR